MEVEDDVVAVVDAPDEAWEASAGASTNPVTIAIDGANVALSAGKAVVACAAAAGAYGSGAAPSAAPSIAALGLVLDYWRARGHVDVVAFLPASWARYKPGTDIVMGAASNRISPSDSALLQQLAASGLVVLVPPSCSDDLFAIDYAYTRDGYVVSNDRFADHAASWAVDAATTAAAVTPAAPHGGASGALPLPLDPRVSFVAHRTLHYALRCTTVAAATAAGDPDAGTGTGMPPDGDGIIHDDLAAWPHTPGAAHVTLPVSHGQWVRLEYMPDPRRSAALAAGGGGAAPGTAATAPSAAALAASHGMFGMGDAFAAAGGDPRLPPPPPRPTLPPAVPAAVPTAAALAMAPRALPAEGGAAAAAPTAASSGTADSIMVTAREAAAGVPLFLSFMPPGAVMHGKL